MKKLYSVISLRNAIENGNTDAIKRLHKSGKLPADAISGSLVSGLIAPMLPLNIINCLIDCCNGTELSGVIYEMGLRSKNISIVQRMKEKGATISKEHVIHISNAPQEFITFMSDKEDNIIFS